MEGSAKNPFAQADRKEGFNAYLGTGLSYTCPSLDRLLEDPETEIIGLI